MSYQRQEADLTDCRDCGVTFNLNGVPYFDRQCPKCRSQDDKSAMCPFCGDEFDPEAGVKTTHHHMNGRSETITVCSEDCAEDPSNRGDR